MWYQRRFDVTFLPPFAAKIFFRGVWLCAARCTWWVTSHRYDVCSLHLCLRTPNSALESGVRQILILILRLFNDAIQPVRLWSVGSTTRIMSKNNSSEGMRDWKAKWGASTTQTSALLSSAQLKYTYTLQIQTEQLKKMSTRLGTISNKEGLMGK